MECAFKNFHLLSIVLLFGCVSATESSAPPVPAAPIVQAQVVAKPLFELLPYPSWRVVGAPANFTCAPDADGRPVLVGRGPIPSNGFLASPRAIADFRLVVDVKLGSAESLRGEKMNSGIQIRSQEKGGAIGGLQVEVDPTPRAWSGGVYDERGRGWLASLVDDGAARASFRLGEWNRFEIECIGPRMRTRVNGVPCAVWYDGIVTGLLAFQVHGGPPCEVAFRAPMFEEIGSHSWRLFVDEAVASSGERCAWSHSIDAQTRGVRMQVEGGGRMEFLAADASRLADVSFLANDDASKPHQLEAVWIDGAGSVLIDGMRAAKLTFAVAPARVRIVGDQCTATQAQRLARNASVGGERVD